MKKITFVWLYFVLALVATSINATELKIGVVNAAAVLDQSPQKAKALAILEKEFATRSKSIAKKLKNLRSKQEKLAKDGAILGADERKAKERTLLSEQRDLKRLQDEYNEDLSIRRNEELRKLEKEVAKTIIDLAKKESYDIVVYQGVIFASDKVDMTPRVIELLKSK